jgi:hypothetical protein
MRHWLSAAIVFAVVPSLCLSYSPAIAQPPYRAGWQELRRPDPPATDYVRSKDYDWTGLNVYQSIHYFNNDPFFSSLTTGNYAGFNFPANDHITVGFNTGRKEYYLHTTGESLFKWKWEPKVEHRAVAEPDKVDPINFPGTFRFFTVAKIEAHAMLSITQTSLPDPFVDLTIISNLPHPSVPEMTKLTPGVFQFDTWDIVETQGNGIDRFFKMKPDLTHLLVGKTATGNPTDVADLWERRLVETVHPISLGMPENAFPPIYNGSGQVFGIPVMGDLYNKFMFDGILDQDGTDTLRLPIGVYIPYTGIMNTLASHVDWDITDSSELTAGLLPSYKTVGADLITPNVLGIPGLMVKAAPAKNEQFGNFGVQLIVNAGGATGVQAVGSQTAKFQAFFKPDAYTHPDAIATGAPNWWHYYNQTRVMGWILR